MDVSEGFPTNQPYLFRTKNVEGAFNPTSGEVIRSAMIRQGVPIAVVDWTCHMLGNRNIKITKGNTTLRGIIESGFPQEGVFISLAVDSSGG